MIPSTTAFLEQDFEIGVEVSHCWGGLVALMSGFEPGMHFETERKEGI